MVSTYLQYFYQMSVSSTTLYENYDFFSIFQSFLLMYSVLNLICILDFKLQLLCLILPFLTFVYNAI